MNRLEKKDFEQLSQRGISEKQIERQLAQFATGFPFLKIEAAATIGHGMMAVDANGRKEFIDKWHAYKKRGDHRILKFVPASGAASRMFKDMFEFLQADNPEPVTEFEKTYFAGIHKFAFYDKLSAACKHHLGKSIDQLMAEGKHKNIVALMLNEDGLNYSRLPKGLLLFHRYPAGVRTPVEEHLVEGALYAESNGEVNIHFTVSHEHLHLFQSLIAKRQNDYATRFNVKYNVSFSEQKQHTDTIAVNPDNTPFRNADGTLLFRPAGHGALIENLNDIEADIVFIKNIDNVVPDRLKTDTTEYKQLIGGILADLQAQTFRHLELLDTHHYTRNELMKIVAFLERAFWCIQPDIAQLSDDALAAYLHKKLNRPIRVCGMVKNEGEPGGGPFITRNNDGSTGLQILESSQIDKNDPKAMEMFKKSTHFNPVDLVCAIKDYRGRKFHLPDYVDTATGFISNKSKDGKELKALELPGLWNGAMSHWNTVFVEVPLTTFNPVKNVNDLLREQHL